MSAALHAQTLPCPNETNPLEIAFDDSILSQANFYDSIRAESVLVVPETEFENLVLSGGVNLIESSERLYMQSSAAEANRLGTLGIVFENPQPSSLQPFIEDHATIAVVRDPFEVTGSGSFQATDYYLVVARVASATTTQLSWVATAPMYASIQVNGAVASAPCSCGNTGTPECTSFPGPTCEFDRCGGGGPDWLSVAPEAFPGGVKQTVDGCTQSRRNVRQNGRPMIRTLSGPELIAQLQEFGVVPDVVGTFCTTCSDLDCSLDMSWDPKNWSSSPPPRDICTGIPVSTTRDCAAGACYGDGSEAGASADLSALGACFGASGGGALDTANVPNVPGEIPPCRVSVPDVCTLVDGDPFSQEYCQSPQRNFLIQSAMACDGGSSPSGGAYTCCDGVANCACTNDTVKLCVDCSSGSCVESAYSSVVDPRLMANYVTLCSDDGVSDCNSTPTNSASETQAVVDEESTGNDGNTNTPAPPAETEQPTVQPLLTLFQQLTKAFGDVLDHGLVTLQTRNTTKKKEEEKSPEDTTDGDPVLMMSGALLMQPTDIRVEGQQYDLTFQRTYFSTSNNRGMLGSNWTHNWEARLEPLNPTKAPDWAPPFCTQSYPTTTCLYYRDGFGNASLFVWDSITQRFAPENGYDSHVVPIRGGGFLMTSAEGATRTFNRDGYLTSDRDRFGNGFTVKLERTPLFAVFQRYCTRLSPTNQAGDPRSSSFDLESQTSQKYGKMCQHLAMIFDDQEMEPLTVEGWPQAEGTPPYDVPLETLAEPTSWEQIALAAEETLPVYRSKILSGLVYMRELALEDYASKAQHGGIRYRPVSVSDDYGRELSFEYERYNNAAELLKSVHGPGGVHLEFDYTSPPGSSEALLSRVRRIPPTTTLPGLDSSQWAAFAANNEYLEFEYEYDFAALTDQTRALQVAFDRYLAYFELYTACWNFTEVECTSGGMNSLADGNPCSFATRAVERLRSAIADNIVTVRRSGEVELFNVYEVDVFSDDFDRVNAQSWGQSSNLHQFQYFQAGPTQRNELPSGAYPIGFPSELEFLVIEDETPQGYASPSAACATTLGDPADCAVLPRPFGDIGDRDDQNVATNPPSGPRGNCGPDYAFNFIRPDAPPDCQPGLMDDYVALLPGYQPTYEYYPRQATSAPRDMPLVQSYLTCDQLAGREYSDPFSAESIGRWQFRNGRWVAEWPEGAREEIELNLGRVCQWTKSTDRNGVATWYGLNYRGQHVVESTETSEGFVTIERRYNADGLVVRETDPFLIGDARGYTDYVYDEVTASSNYGWGAYAPAMWATRQNLLEARYHPIAPVLRFNQETGIQETVAETFVRYRWEPIFNQMRSMVEGSVLSNGETRLHRMEYRLFDYQELAPPVVDNGRVQVLSDGATATSAMNTVVPVLHRMLRQGGAGDYIAEDDNLAFFARRVDMVDGNQITSGNSVQHILLKGMRFGDEDINGDGIKGFNRTEPGMRGLGVPIKIVEVDLDKTPNHTRAITLSYAPHGELASVRDTVGNLTEFAYYPLEPQNRASAFGTGAFPSLSDASNGDIGFLAYVKKSHPMAYDEPAFERQSCQSADVPGPYRFILPSCGSSVAQSLTALGVPAQVASAITSSASPDITYYAYSEIGLPRRVWTHDANHYTTITRDADGRVVSELTSDGRLTVNTLDVFGRVTGTDTFEGGQLRAQTVATYNLSGKPTKVCKAATQGACAWMNTTPNNPPANTDWALQQFFYDDEDLVTLTIDPEGTTRLTQYDERRRPVRELISDGSSTREKRTTYDVRNRVTQVGYGPTGGLLVESFGYDHFGAQTIHVDRRYQPWYSAYSTRGNLLSVCHNDSDCSPSTTMATTQGLDVRQFTYNDFDEVLSETHNDEFVTTYTRRLDGAVASKTATNAETQYFAYDKYGNAVWAASGDSQQFEVIDPISRTRASVVLNGSMATTRVDAFDDSGRVVSSTQFGSDGVSERTTTFAFELDRQTASTDPTGRLIEQEFDLLGRLMLRREQRPTGFDVTEYVTNRRGQVTSLLDPSGQVTTYEYNGFGELKSRKVPSAGVETWTYDLLGRQETWKQGDEWVRYDYNVQGDLHVENWGGRLGNSTEELAVERLYDALGRPTRVDSTNLGVLPFGISGNCAASGFVRKEFSYDMAGRRVADSLQIGTCSPVVMSTTWSTLNDEWQRDVTYPGGNGNLVHSQLFDGQGRLHEQEVGWIGLPSGTTLSTAWDGDRMSQRATSFAAGVQPLLSDAAYDVFGARTQWSISHAGTSLFDVEIQRDVLSRVRSVTTEFDGGISRWDGFEYDVRHHLTTTHAANQITFPVPSVGTHVGATNTSVAATAAMLSATASSRVREDAVGATLTISNPSGPVWQATTTGGAPGRDVGHRLQN
ncbi:MAG: DUF6531 domain-containing protein, partial [bacterium]